jgi:hypothetical protein
VFEDIEMRQIDLKTPNLRVQSSEQFDGISPTKPLNFNKSSQARPIKPNSHPHQFTSEQSLNSILTQDTEYSLNSYETAIEYQGTNKAQKHQQSTIIQDGEKSSLKSTDSNNGLGIQQLSLREHAGIDKDSTYSSKPTISVHNDEPTPKINIDFIPSHTEHGFGIPGGFYDEPTPIIPSKADFSYNSPNQETPIVRQEPYLSRTPEQAIPSSPQSSIVSNTEIAETPIPVQVKQVYESPRKETVSRRSSPTKATSDQNSVTSATNSNDQSYSSGHNDTTTYSHESTFLNQLQDTKERPEPSIPLNQLSQPKAMAETTSKRVSKFVPNKEDYSLASLFVASLHSFDSNSLELNSDSAICLSFEKEDIVFIHSVDPSGWAEVTLIKSLKRGWVPINYFSKLIEDEKNLPLTKSKTPLRNLLISSAIFLNNPASAEHTEASFSLSHINNIKDGVRDLLEETDCLSRSSDIVKKKPVIRRMRKSLLADWYSLMIKADSYKHSKSLVHLETLQSMVLQVIKKSATFLEIWGLESESLKREEQREKTNITKSVLADVKSHGIKYRENPPFAKERLNEIHNVLFNYIGLLLGRLDMVEHNPSGCQVLENITHQMILLLREILFISKSCMLILNDRNNRAVNKFDDNLDTLLSLVSELVSGVKNFVTKTIDDDFSTSTVKVKDSLYYYTPEGDELIGVISRMTGSISSSIENCYKNMALTGDFKLSEGKKYPDFQEIQIAPEKFIKVCSEGMIKTLPNKESDLKSLKTRKDIKRQSRFSMVRSGLGNENSLTTSGSNLLQEFLPDSKSFIRNSVFEPFLTDSNEEYQLNQDIKSEVVRDSDDRLVGASFRALVMILTDELSNLDPFFISTFFLTFKSYSTGVELIEELIGRFNLANKISEFEDQEETGDYSSYKSRLKNRRKLVCKMFQIWLQSYWDYVNDYNLLPTLVNFFNEGVSLYLPIESKRLIQLCSKLTVLTPSKVQDSKNLQKYNSASIRLNSLEPLSSAMSFNNSGVQLVKRHYSNAKHSSLISHSSSVYSISSLNKELDDDDYIFEEYGLAKLNSSNRSSMLLPLPGISFKNNSLLSKSQIQEIESLVLIYRRNLSSTFWIHENDSRYYPVGLKTALDKWFEISQLPSSNVIGVEYNLCELNSFELAKQLTIIESSIFLSIKPDELLNNNYSEKRAKLNMSPNIAQSLLFTNALSEYVLESILDLNLSNKKRIIRIRNWLNVALSCYYLKNFNSLAAIIITLQNHILSRLTELWNELPDKYQNLFEDLKKIIHPSNNYKGYRYKISRILEDVDTKPTPVVPYINLFLQDLTFIHEGNRDFRNSNSFLRARIINFDKFLRISRVVSNLEHLQVGYDGNSLNSHTKKSKRSSIFSLTSSMSSMNEELSPILPLQEFILLDLWRVHQLNLKDNDRNWTLSKRLKT